MKLAILDKDGTLTQPKSGKQFVQSPDDQELMPGVKEAIAALVADGYTLVIASNQGGVEAGHKSLDDAIAEMQYCMSLLPEIQTAFFCPDFAGDDCVIVSKSDSLSRYGKLFRPYRKPHPGMLKAIILHESLMEPSQIVMIGDRPEDEQAAEGAGISFIHADAWRKG